MALGHANSAPIVFASPGTFSERKPFSSVFDMSRLKDVPVGMLEAEQGNSCCLIISSLELSKGPSRIAISPDYAIRHSLVFRHDSLN